jgi:hypothetical protein
MYDLKKNIIFTHPPKCGGTSIEKLLGYLDERRENPEIGFLKHASLKRHVEEVSKTHEIDCFFKFSIVRNPWDRAVSYYNHVKYKAYEYYKENVGKVPPEGVYEARKLNFKEFIFKYYKTSFNSDKVTKPFMLLDGKLSVDKVIRLEFLEKDFLEIKDRLGIEDDYIMPHLNDSRIFLEKRSYKEYYDEESKNLIEYLFKWDIVEFNYSFD